MHDRLLGSALGIAPPWFVAGVGFDKAGKVLTVGIDFKSGTRFAAEGASGEHPLHDTLTKVPQGLALVAAEGSRQPQTRGRRRSGRPDRQDDHRAHRTGLGLQGAVARDPRSQTDQRRT